MRSRDIGLGAMGFHEYLQYKGIAFESDKARLLNKDIFQTIKSKAKSMSMELFPSLKYTWCSQASVSYRSLLAAFNVFFGSRSTVPLTQNCFLTPSGGYYFPKLVSPNADFSHYDKLLMVNSSFRTTNPQSLFSKLRKHLLF